LSKASGQHQQPPVSDDRWDDDFSNGFFFFFSLDFVINYKIQILQNFRLILRNMSLTDNLIY
jgi:hypothetical protein